MPEQQRAKFYDWVREHTDGGTAEYVMSCLAPAPLPDLVTKQHLDTVLAAEFSEFALNTAAQREADRNEATAHREAMAAQREADRNEATAHREAMAAQREADRDIASKRHRLLVGAAIVLAVEIVAAEAGWLRLITDLLASAF